MKPKITGSIGSSGTVSIESAKIPQRNVEGLEDALGDILIVANDSRKRVGDLEQDFSSHKNDFERFLKAQVDINDTVNDKINDTNLQHNVFKSAQTNFNEDQIGINLAHFTLIKEIHKTLIIGFSVLVVFMLATWGYLTYTFFKQ